MEIAGGGTTCYPIIRPPLMCHGSQLFSSDGVPWDLNGGDGGHFMQRLFGTGWWFQTMVVNGVMVVNDG